MTRFAHAAIATAAIAVSSVLLAHPVVAAAPATVATPVAPQQYPTTEWSKDALIQYANAHGITVRKSWTKVQICNAIYRPVNRAA